MNFIRKPLLTPKDLADAIGVSESALRRWVDGGRIRMSRTAGGHRRIPLQEAIRFIRQTGATVVRPELLGLSLLPTEAQGAAASSRDDALFSALREGDAAVARGLILSSYLSGLGLAALFDGPVRSAMDRVGQLWQHEARGIMVEHRATAICMESIAQLRGLLPAVDEHSPLAVGGAPQDDPYQLPTMMAAATLAEAGFREINFGPNTPVELLAEEAIERRAGLVWLSISVENDPKHLRVAVRKLADKLVKHDIDLVLGGRFSGACVPRSMSNVTLAASMSDLSAAAAVRGMLNR
ncbi:MAG TPA: helix-turn-helix domain-containing protein [Bryobacteraceae bacterium]|nr:helix-turn-helix domain-containing protein [Bryobacteraceae bacterium]